MALPGLGTCIVLACAVIVCFTTIVTHSRWQPALFPGSECGVVRAWLQSRTHHAHYTAESAILNLQHNAGSRGDKISRVADDVMRVLGWSPGMQFARFGEGLSARTCLRAPRTCSECTWAVPCGPWVCGSLGDDCVVEQPGA